MMTRTIRVNGLVFGVTLAAMATLGQCGGGGPAMAAPICASFKDVVGLLKAAGEVPISRALGSDGSLVLRFDSAKSKTWSLVTVAAGKDPRACIVVTGKDWQEVDKRGEQS